MTAAMAAAERGADVVLLAPERRLGGMTSGGLGATDVGDPAAIGGLAREFYRAVDEHYERDESFRFEPRVAEAILRRWLEDHRRVRRIRGSPIVRTKRARRRIVHFVTEDGAEVPGRVFIDASYEGDLMARSGVRFRVGREAVDEYGESLNGIRCGASRHQFDVPVDPYVVPRRPESGLLPSIEASRGAPGSADARIEAYNYRLCLTLEEKNRRPFPKPRRYDARRYELLARLIAARREAGKRVRFSDLFMIVALPNGKTDVNAWGAFSTDHLGASHDYPRAGETRRLEIRIDHADHVRGLFHFLTTDARVPVDVRREAALWGLCRDEFPETRGWPHQLYVREARRMVGETVITQRHCEDGAAAADPVAVAAFLIDTHNCRRIVTDRGAWNEGDVEVETPPFSVRYGALVPNDRECENLLVPVCVSATHTAYGAVRTEPVFMALGEAAGLAAAQAAERSCAVQAIDRAKLRRELEERGCVLTPSRRTPGSEPWPHQRFRYESSD